MNDPLEERLQKQALREIPAAWRAEILSGAQAAVSATQPHPVKESIPWQQWPGLIATKLWGELFWPSRYAWSGVAAVWLGLLVINQSIYDEEVRAQSRPVPTSEVIQAAQAQRRILAELAGPLSDPQMDRPKPRPQSSRESEKAFV